MISESLLLFSSKTCCLTKRDFWEAMAQKTLFLTFKAALELKSRLLARNSNLCASKGCGAIGLRQGMRLCSCTRNFQCTYSADLQVELGLRMCLDIGGCWNLPLPLLWKKAIEREDNKKDIERNKRVQQRENRATEDTVGKGHRGSWWFETFLKPVHVW